MTQIKKGFNFKLYLNAASVFKVFEVQMKGSVWTAQIPEKTWHLLWDAKVLKMLSCVKATANTLKPFVNTTARLFVWAEILNF